MKIFHVDRDYSRSLEQQKKELEQQHINFEYLYADGANGHPKIHFLAEEKKEEKSLSILNKGE